MIKQWVYLCIAGVCEIIWALGLKLSVGFSKPIPSIVTVLFMILSIVFLELSIRVLPLGIAYAIWVAIGIAGTSIGSVLLCGDRFSLLQGAFLVLLTASVIGLKFASNTK